jgi:hypothetical protein
VNPTPTLPEFGHFVSACDYADDVLTIRFTPESVLEVGAVAFVVQACRPSNIEATLTFLHQAIAAAEYLYIFWRDGALLIVDEGGNEIMILAEEFFGEPTSLSVEELKSALIFCKSLYDNAHSHGCLVESRLHALRKLLVEQARRIEIKTASHGRESTAGVLYAQQLAFIERLLRASNN